MWSLFEQNSVLQATKSPYISRMAHSLYLTFNGNAETAINYYRDHLGAEIISMQRFGEAPMPVAESDKQKVLHAIVNLQGFTIMVSDAPAGQEVQFGNNFSIALDFPDEGALNQAFQALSDGGKVTMPVQDTFWNAVFGMCCDQFGVNWMFNHDKVAG